MKPSLRNVALVVFAGSLSASASAAGCSKSDDSSSTAAEEAAREIKLKNFDYEMDKLALTALGSRVGCDNAAKYMRFPRDGSLKQSISKVLTTPSVYATFLSELGDRESIKNACGDAPQITDKNAGIKHLLNAAKVNAGCTGDAPCEPGLTFIMVGGLTGAYDKDGPWAESRAQWKQLAGDGEVPKKTRADGSTDSALRVWRLDCDKSFLPDDECVPNMMEKLKSLEATEPSAFKQQYFFVGHNKGGNSIVHALGLSKDLREKTLGVMTLGAPMAGSVVMAAVPDSVRGALLTHLGVSGSTEQSIRDVINQNPLGFLMAGLVPPDAADQLSRAADDFTRGVSSLSMQARKQYLYEWLPSHDFTRSSGRAIPILHVAGLVDVADLAPLPKITVRDGKITGALGPNTLNDLTQSIFLPMLRDFPLTDTMVSLEHAVIPKQAVVPGLAPSVHAILSLDQLRMRLRPQEGDPIPYLDVADALVDSAASRIEGGAR
jgi:hypothetical protein